MSKHQRILKLAVVVAALVALLVNWRFVSADESQVQVATEPINMVGYGSTLAQKLGEDDGAKLIIHFTGDVHGDLDVCSCKGKVLGGMARRVGFLKVFDAKFPAIPDLLVDTGGFLNDRSGEHGFLINWAVTRDQWVMEGYQKFGYEVVNLSSHELPYLSRILSSGDKLPGTSGDNPLDIVSANVEVGGEAIPIRPFVVVDAKGKDKSRGLKVALVGISDKGELTPAGFKVLDPIPAAKKAVSEARSKADAVVVLAHLSTDEAVQLAKNVPGIDVLIDGNQKEFTVPQRIGKTLVVFTSYETHSLGEVRLYRSAEGGVTARNRYITMDESVTDDPEATKFIAVAVADVKGSVKKFANGSAVPPQPAVNPKDSPFATANACFKCHQEQYMAWRNSPHARATTSLAPKSGELEAGCFVCHTTGFEKAGFHEGPGGNQFANVQCEQCHGPGKEHIAHPDKNYGHIANVAALCSSCHTGQTSPKFEAESALAAIKH